MGGLAVTPQEFVVGTAGEILKVIMTGAVGLLGFSMLKEISK